MTNEEKYLAKIAGENVETPEPVLRKEQYLNYIANESGEIPELPATREERYLAILAGQEYEIPAPELRIEQYMAKACGLEIEVPTPITRVEQYWAKIAETTEITGTLPLTITSRVAGALKNYRIFGTAAGAGVQTINLLDVDARDMANGYVATAYLATDGTEHPSPSGYAISEYIPVSPSTQYSICSRKVSGVSLCFYNASKEYISGVSYTYARPRRFTSPSNAVYLRMTIIDVSGGRDMLLAGYYDEEPAYEPFGYKIPLTLTSGQNTDDYLLYIGSTKLGEEEYVDYQEQKVYKDVSGVLTPTDPPTPLPAIIAYEGENTLSSTETLGEVTIKGHIKETGDG